MPEENTTAQYRRRETADVSGTDGTGTEENMDDDLVLDAVPGARDAREQITEEAAQDAFRELLGVAQRLGLKPRQAPLGRETSFSFGAKRYPLCRVNQKKGIAFHGAARAHAMIIRSTGDDSFQQASRVLRRTALAQSLDAYDEYPQQAAKRANTRVPQA